MKRCEWSARCLGALLLIVATASSGAQLRLESVLGASDVAGFARADRVRSFTFPADHGPHPAYRSEWWYVTMNLRSTDGAEFGAQFTVFRQATAPGPVDVQRDPWSSAQLYLGHFALTDVARRRHVEAERLARAHPELAGARAAPFAVWIDGWRLADRDDGSGSFELVARADGMRVDLVLAPLKGPVLQGDRGLSAKGPDQASYYYSLPRLSVRGTLESAGQSHRVEGRAWFDREWSTSLLSAGQDGWDWFGLHLDSGDDLMAFQLRRSDGRRDPYDQAAWIDSNGIATPLAVSAFQLQPLRWWRDANGIDWPIEWRLTIRLPDGERDLRIVAAVDDQRMDTLLTYWEGLVFVQDGEGRRIGAGYMELTGYD